MSKGPQSFSDATVQVLACRDAVTVPIGKILILPPALVYNIVLCAKHGFFASPTSCSQPSTSRHQIPLIT